MRNTYFPVVQCGALEICGNGIDDNCNGEVDEGCSVCDEGETAKCPYTGDIADEGVGLCKAGTKTCTNGQWGACGGEVLPALEACDTLDNNCDGNTDETCAGPSCDNVPAGSTLNPGSGNLYHDQPVGKSGVTLSYNSIDKSSGALGRGWTHTYNESISSGPTLDSIALRKPDGRVVYFKFSSGAYHPEARSGEHASIVKRSDNTFALAHKDGSVHAFDSSGKLASMTDRNNNSTVLTYAANNLVSVADPAGRVTGFAYDGQGRIIGVTAPGGATTTFAYDGGGNLASVTDANGGAWTYTYGAGGKMTSKTTPAGATTAYAYDSSGRLASSTDATGNVKTFSYDPANATVTAAENGAAYTYTYDPALDVRLAETDPLGNVTRYAYDSIRNLLSKTLPDGSSESYAYDADGNLASKTNADGTTEGYTYNSFGQPTSMTDGLGNTTRYEYDAKGNLVSATDPSGATTAYEHDARGNVTKITDGMGRTTLVAYDAQNNVSLITDAAGAITSFTYDAAGNAASTTAPDGAITRLEYDAIGGLVKITDASGSATSYAYDAAGNRVSETDAEGNATVYAYDGKARLVSATDALGNVTKYAYASSGCPSCGGGPDKLASVTDANGNATTYDYDALGRLIKETDPLGNSIAYTYDARGNIATRIDANGATINYTYDAQGRLLKKTFADGTSAEFTYDARGNIITARNASASYSMSYDARGKLTAITDSNGRSISYSYDSTGARTKMTTPEGHTVNYNYDPAGRLSAIINGGGRRYEFGYDAMGRRTSLRLPNGVKTAYAYDSLGRLTSLTHRTSSDNIIDSFAYTHDRVGNRLSKTQTPSPLAGEGGGEGVRYYFAYDKFYRLLDSLTTKLNGKTPSPLAGEDKGEGVRSESFTYDAVGNRLIGPEAKTGYTYDAGNELVSIVPSPNPPLTRGDTGGSDWGEGTTFTYDKNGNLTKKTKKDDDGETKTYTYGYDYENRLTKVVKQESNETETVSFKYDPFGRRIEKKVEEIEDGKTESKTYTYVYDNEDIILEYLTKADGKIETASYVHGPGIDEPLAIERKGEVFYYHADGLGSIAALTDKKQKVVESYTYSSFGELKRKGDKVKNTFTFTGREWDKEVELYYYRARYYDPKTGRFISRDPIGFRGGDVNLYSYVGQNPVRWKDPLGLWVDPFSYLGGFVGAIGDFYKNYSDMRQANWKAEGTDKYFHCKANCEAAQRGPGGSDAACTISNTREWWDQNIKRYPASDSAEDQVANQYGRNQGTINRGASCTQICEPFRPPTLPPQY